MNSIKEKFTRIFRKNCVDVNEPVDNDVSDNDKFKFCESSISPEEVQVENAGNKDVNNKDVKPAKNYNDVHYMTEEEWERRQRSKLCRMQLITLLLFPILLPIMIISMLFDIFVSLIRKIVSKFTSTNKENEESRCSEHDKEL